MNKKTFKIHQPQAYQLLKNTIKNNRLHHAYFIQGGYEQDRIGLTKIVTKSLICDNLDEDGLCCDKCSQCKRVDEGTFHDYIFLDGSKNTIKKEQMLQIQNKFQTTTLERTQLKVYVIHHIENATTESMNSILKFLEEPESKIYAFLLSDEGIDVLDTIQSRCQFIRLHKTQRKQLELQFQEFMSSYSSRILSHFYNEVEEAKSYEESFVFQSTLSYFQTFVEQWNKSDHDALTSLHQHFQDKNVEAHKKDVYLLFLYLLKGYAKDIILNDYPYDDWYQRMICNSKIEVNGCIKMINILTTYESNLNFSTSILLLCDELIYVLKEVRKR